MFGQEGVSVTHLPLKDHSSKPNPPHTVLGAEMGRGEEKKGRNGEGQGKESILKSTLKSTLIPEQQGRNTKGGAE